MTQIAKSNLRGRSDFLSDTLQIFALCSFAIAQPLLDLLGRQAEFFAVRRSEPIDILLLVGILSFGLPLLIIVAEGGVSLLGWRVRKGVHSLALTSLAAAIALQGLKRIEALPGIVLVIGALILGVTFAVAALRFSPIRMFLTILSPAALLFPALFLFHPTISKVVFPQKRLVVSPAKIEATTPIVMLVLDELPLTSLLDKHRQIDPIRYPNFAALAKDSTWFRNATTVSGETITAVPAILTGNYPKPFLNPTVYDHPQNLFTFLGGSYNLKVFETLTHLCPDTLCGDVRHEDLATRMNSLWSDLLIVFFHVVLPKDLTIDLPSISKNWQGFANEKIFAKTKETAGKEQRSKKFAKKERDQQFIAFVNTIESLPTQTLYFHHSVLPHSPYVYLPSGKRHSYHQHSYGSEWTDEWLLRQGYQRHLLQVSYVDTLLGKLLARLKEVGLYNRALIVVTADHGICFRINTPARGLSKANFQDIMPVPLFIKAPNQHEGQINDRNVETIDILPTIADIVGVPLPWAVDGHSALDPSTPERQEKRCYPINSQQPLVTNRTVFANMHVTLEKKFALFGSDSPTTNLFNIGPYSEIVGLHINDATIQRAEGGEIGLNNPDIFTNVDPKADFIPAEISGYANWNGNSNAPLNLAISVNGVIRATTKTVPLPSFSPRKKTQVWEAMVDETSFRSGSNDVEVFEIISSHGAPVLARVDKATTFNYQDIALGGQWIQGVEESGFWGEERGNKKSIRWTNGKAKLIIPNKTRKPPKALRVNLAATGPDGTSLTVLINQEVLFDHSIPAGKWTKTFNLTQRSLKDAITIELISDTFVPKAVIPGSADVRTLGVAVEAIILLDKVV